MDDEIEFPIRINRYLAVRGIVTRKAADGLIAKGLVLINGERAALGAKVNADDHVEVTADMTGKRYRYIAYYKPRGIISHSPEKREKGIADVFSVKGVFPVGRLDKASEGLIILTDDGRITERLLHPRFVHEKEYEVKIQEAFKPRDLARLTQGIESEGERLTAKRVKLLDQQSLEIVLTEGKKHQIRRMLAALHLTVKELRRVRILDVHLGTLEPGEGRELRGKELDTFLRSLSLPVGRTE